MILSAITSFGAIRTSTEQRTRLDFNQNIRQTAFRGAEVFGACANETASGIYSITSLIQAGFLPTGYPSSTPMGNQWVCQVTTGGPQGRVIIVTWNAAPTSISGLFSQPIKNSPSYEQELAYDIAELDSTKLSANKDIISGIIGANTTVMTATDGMANYDLSGYLTASSFAEPVMVKGLAASD